MKRSQLIRSIEALQGGSREDLIRHIVLLQNALSSTKPRKKLKTQRPIDFSAYHSKWIALRIAYDGAEYHGMASQQGCSPHSIYQADSVNKANMTVEDVLFGALIRIKLISSVNECKFSRCGRTDAGVSAIGQVVGLCVRGPKRSEEDVSTVHPPYAVMLNSSLPPDVRVVNWGWVPEGFNARFDCQWREYRYFFAKSGLNIDAMKEAAEYLLGEHDFRNFCCKDPSKGDAQSYIRTILKAEIIPTEAEVRDTPFSMHQLLIRGNAFLYHQVRCTMGILFLVGRGLEPSTVIKDMLDLNVIPSKPCYEMASDTPLVLSDAGYPDELIRWQGITGSKDGAFARYEMRACQMLAMRYVCQQQHLQTDTPPLKYQPISGKE